MDCLSQEYKTLSGEKKSCSHYSKPSIGTVCTKNRDCLNYINQVMADIKEVDHEAFVSLVEKHRGDG